MNAIQHYNLENRAIAYQWSHSSLQQPLVVLHGLGDSAIHTYAPRFASTTLARTPSLFIDLPGFGEGWATDGYTATIEALSQDVLALLHSLDINDTTVFAHSMGANVAIEIARVAPALTSRLILAEPLLRPNHSQLAAGIAKHSEQSFVERRYHMLVRATSLQAHRGDPAAGAFLQTVRLANPVTMYRAAASLVHERNPDFASRLGNLPVERTLLAGERTRICITELEHIGINAIRIANAGHAMMVEQPHATAQEVIGLLR